MNKKRHLRTRCHRFGDASGRSLRKLKSARQYARLFKKKQRRKERGGRSISQKLRLRPNKSLLTGNASIDLPKHMNFDQNIEETLRFFRNLNRFILEDPKSEVFINHSTCESISPEAALVIIAHMNTACYFEPHCQKFCNKPMATEVNDVLAQIGYYNYLIGLKSSPPNLSDKFFLAHKTGNVNDPKIVRELIEHLQPELNFSTSEKQALYKALIESLGNTLEHAYPNNVLGERRVMERRWWMLGCRDRKTHEVFFCFYDNGVGIPRTIRTRWKDRIPMVSLSDGEIIEKAVVEGSYSKHKDSTRGTGLPALKAFIDVTETGSLSILSYKSKCTFESKNRTSKSNFKDSINGTLIAWKLKRNGVEVYEDN